jgi:hypothetical protein
MHDTDQIAEKRTSCNFSILYAVEIRIAQKGHFAARRNPEPGTIQKSHQMPHADHPVRLIDLTGSGKKDVLLNVSVIFCTTLP